MVTSNGKLLRATIAQIQHSENHHHLISLLIELSALLEQDNGFRSDVYRNIRRLIRKVRSKQFNDPFEFISMKRTIINDLTSMI